MKDASQHPVSDGYGATYSPWSKTKPHLGEDRKMPEGTPVKVNGITIGLSGSTGKSTGPHLHIQKVQKGIVVSPKGQGFNLANPNVIETGEKPDIGKYIRIQDAQGTVWSYFHLSKVNVTKGELMDYKAKAEEYKKAAAEWEATARKRLAIIVEQTQEISDLKQQIVANQGQFVQVGELFVRKG